jgi:hypothetical protein
MLSFNEEGGGGGIMLQAEGRWFDSRYSHWIFLIALMLPASNIIEYQESFLG